VKAELITVAVKKPADGELTDDQQTPNKAHNNKRAVGERGNSLLKTSFKRCAESACAPTGSAQSSPPHSSCSTSNTDAPTDHHDTPLPGKLTGSGALRFHGGAGLGLRPGAGRARFDPGSGAPTGKVP
jgi:hypothetical protein